MAVLSVISKINGVDVAVKASLVGGVWKVLENMKLRHRMAIACAVKTCIQSLGVSGVDAATVFDDVMYTMTIYEVPNSAGCVTLCKYLHAYLVRGNFPVHVPYYVKSFKGQFAQLKAVADTNWAVFGAVYERALSGI
jgi:hypothetical protein